MYQTVVEAVLDHAERQPSHLAIAFKKEQLTYQDLAGRIKGTAQVLRDKYNVGAGDFVMISAVSTTDYVVGYLAVQYLGAVSIPIDKTQTSGIDALAEYIQPKLMLLNFRPKGETENYVLLKDVCAQGRDIHDIDKDLVYILPNDNALAEILLTTGTTGKPKGGMLSIGNVRASAENTRCGVGMLESDVILLPLPLNHSVAMRVMRTTLQIGATLILQNGFTFARELENNIENFHCTGLVSVPASLEMVYRQMQEKFPEIMGKLRYIEIGAGSLSIEMKQRLLRILPDTKVINTWGSTETGGAIFLNLNEYPDKVAALGKPVTGVDLKVIDDQGAEVEAVDVNTAGRMCLRGSMQMMGYYHMPEVTSQTLVDGWLYTNDLVYLDNDGFIYMLGRADDIINVGGEKVAPVEVENAAQQYEKIMECACIGVDDPEGLLGRVPVLYYVSENGVLDKDDLARYLSSRIEKYKLPHYYIEVARLPRNRMEKLDRHALSKMWEDEQGKNLMNDVIKNILGRRSIHEFTEENIPKAYLEMILQCGYYAPSGHNMQTWRFTVIQDENMIHRIKECVGSVAKEQNVYFYGFQNPKVLILISNDRRNKDGIQDSSCAAENMMLAAHSYGIGSVWINALMTICDVPEIRSMLNEFGIPGNHIVWSMLAMGYPQKPGELHAKKTDVVKWI